MSLDRPQTPLSFRQISLITPVDESCAEPLTKVRTFPYTWPHCFPGSASCNLPWRLEYFVPDLPLAGVQRHFIRRVGNSVMSRVNRHSLRRLARPVRRGAPGGSRVEEESLRPHHIFPCRRERSLSYGKVLSRYQADRRLSFGLPAEVLQHTFQLRQTLCDLGSHH